MLPGATTEDLLHCREGSPVLGDQECARFSSSAPSADVKNSAGGEMGAPVRLSSIVSLLTLASLRPHVAHIVEGSSEKQVRWVAAGRIVTAMANVHSWRDGAIFRFPSDAVCGERDALFAAPAAEDTIAATVTSPDPLPTSVRAGRLIDVSRKAFAERNLRRSHCKDYT